MIRLQWCNISIFLFLVFCCNILHAQWNSGTITLDGNNSESAYVNYNDWSMSWDNTYLYIVKKGGDTTHPCVLYFDFQQHISPVNGTNAQGSLTGITDYSVTPRLPFRSQHRIYWTYKYAENRESDGSGGWGSAAVMNSTDYAYNATFNTDREIRLAWSSIFGLSGRPSSFRFLGLQIDSSSSYIYHPAPEDNPTGVLTTPNTEKYFRIVTTDSANITPPFSRNNYTFRGTNGANIGDMFDYYDFTHYQNDTIYKTGKWNHKGNVMLHGDGAILKCVSPDSLLVGDSLMILNGQLFLGDSISHISVNKNLSNYDTLIGCGRDVNAIYIKGDFRNLGFLRIDSSSVVLNRTNTAQTILGDFSRGNALFRLEIDNPDGVVEMGSDSVSIRNRLTLTEGVLHSNGKLVLREGASISPVGGSSDSYIDSAFYWHRYSADTCILPLGRDGEFAPLGLDPVNSATNRIYLAKYSNKGYGDYSLKSGSNLDHVSFLEYWDVALFGVTSQADKETRISLYWRNFSDVSLNSGERDSLRVAHYDGADWEMTDNTPLIKNISVSDGVVKSSFAVHDFSPFTLSTTITNNPLPVSLLDFSGKYNDKNKSVDITWKTALENDCQFFELYKNTQNEEGFLTKFACDVLSNQMKKYQFTDFYPAANNFYWLKQLDLNGNFEWFGPIEIQATHKVLIFPNPVKSGSDVTLSFNEGIREVSLFNTLGQKVFSDMVDSRSLVIKNLRKGVYILHMRSNNLSISKHKIIVF